MRADFPIKKDWENAEKNLHFVPTLFGLGNLVEEEHEKKCDAD
jgi:hypothetical protein